MTANREECSCRKKLVLPPILPWESGSNKFASQKGESPFGATRHNVLPLDPPKPDPNPPFVVDNRPIPPFGGPRPEITRTIINHEKSDLRHQYSPAVNKDPPKFDKTPRHQNLNIKSTKTRKLTKEEEQSCKSALPRFVSPSSSISHKHEKGLKENRNRGHRSTWYGDYSVTGSEERQRYLAWMGGQLTTVRPLGHPSNETKPHTFYEKLMAERQIKPELLAAKLDAYAAGSSQD